MPDAFVMRELVSFDEQQGPTYHFVDADLTKFLASFSLNIPIVFPLYLKDSFDENNLYFGNYRGVFKLAHRIDFDSSRNFDDIQDDEYNGNLDLTNYINLLNAGGIG